MSRTPTTTRRHRAAPRRRWVWPTALALVVAVVTALLGSGATYALWNGTASTTASTVKSGSATITVSPLTAMNTSRLAPGASTTGTFSVTNTGSTALGMRVMTTATKVSYANTTDAAVLGEVTLKLSLVSSAAACRPGVGGYSARVATFDTGSGYLTLPTGGGGVGCVEMTLDSDAPQAVSGAVVDFTLTVTGTQVAP
jgi:hypothetical protein